MMKWAEPFDQYGGDEAAMLDGPWAELATPTWSLSTTIPRTGTYSLRLKGDDAANAPGLVARRVFNDSLTEAGVAFGFYCTSLPDTENAGADNTEGFYELISFRDAANARQLTFMLGTNGQVVLFLGGQPYRFGAAFLATLITRSDPTNLVRAAAYQHLEFKVGIANGSGGYAECRLNGVTIINASGIDTQFTALAETSQFAMGNIGITAPWGTAAFCYVDDLIAWDASGAYNNDFVGDKKVYWLPPNGDTAQADFTPSTGATSYGVVDESPPNDSDFLSLAASTGKTDLQLTNLPADVVAVVAVMPLMRSWKSDAGTCDMAPGVSQGGTYSTPVGQPQTTLAQYYAQVIEEDPASGMPFSPADVNSLDLVLERTA